MAETGCFCSIHRLNAGRGLMRGLNGMRYGLVCALLMLDTFGAPVYASGACFPEVLSDREAAYIHALDRELDYQLRPNDTLPAFDKAAIVDKNGDDKNPRLIKDITVELSSDDIRLNFRHRLRTPLIVQASDGRQFYLREGTDFGYTLPKSESSYRVTIPSGTELIRQAGEPPTFKLAKQTTATIRPPQDYRISITLDKERVVDRIPETGAMGTTLEITPRRAPVGEYISLTIQNRSFDFNKARFRVCLKKQEGNKTQYFPSKSVELEEVKMDEAVLRVRIPDIGVQQPHLGQQVDLLVVARHSEKKEIAEAVSKEFLVSSQPLALGVWILAFILPWLFAGIVTGRKDKVKVSCFNPIWFVSGKYGNASLSLAQILLWSILVFSASFYVLVVSGTLLALTEQVLMLLGITGGSSIIAKITASARDSVGREIANPVVKKPRWLDLFQTEGRPDLYKVQMALFTTLAAIFVTGKIYNTLEFPELPAGLLALIGISNGVYLGAKATSRTIFEKLADKDKEFQKAENDLKRLSEEAESATKEYTAANKRKTEAESAAKETKELYEKETDPVKKEQFHDLFKKQADTAEEEKVKFESAEKKKKEADEKKSAAQGLKERLKESLEAMKEEALEQE